METHSPILVTGVNGFIASHLAERLVREGWLVRGLARRPESAAWLVERGVEVVSGDLLDDDALARAAQGCRSVLHAAAWTGGPELTAEQAWRTNVAGTFGVIAAAQRAGVERLAYISSVAVYGINNSPLIDECAPTPPVGQQYPDSKIAAEAAVRASGLPYVIVRPASTYGPRGGAWTIGPLERIKRGQLILAGADDGLVTPGYIENVVNGLLLALTHPAAVGEAFNVCDDTAVTYREFYLAYARMLGKDHLPMLPAPLYRRAHGRPVNALRRLLGKPTPGVWSWHFRFNPSQFSVEKAKRLLGYRPAVSFEEGMRHTETWLRANGYI
jgi:nucleoside-diphosphate-sugar epimerase